MDSRHASRRAFLRGSGLGMAALLSAYFLVSIGLIVWRGLKEINHQSQIQNPE